LLLQVDAAGFEKAMEEAREKSRAAGKKTGVSHLASVAVCDILMGEAV
jgi:hypothetical protein